MLITRLSDSKELNVSTRKLALVPYRDTEAKKITDLSDSDKVNLESSLPYEGIATKNTEEDYSSNYVYVNENTDTSKYIPNAQSRIEQTYKSTNRSRCPPRYLNDYEY
ncbi:hypothetical protein GJ496_002698 [Pomphorhynchus laevis]|nr:hypothetical protein GJ496_002698 [Pomphorhynchus laevis]